MNAIFPKSLIAFGKVQFNKHDRNVNKIDVDLPCTRVWLGSLIPVCNRCSAPVWLIAVEMDVSLKETHALFLLEGVWI